MTRAVTLTGRRTRRALFVAAFALAGAKLSVLGCDDTGSYIFSGEQYDPTLQCLEPVSSIDIIAGNPPGSCAPVCILSLPQDGGQIAYVSTMCGPYPNYPFETDAGGDPLCLAAMDAFNRDALCEDGGVVVLDGGDAAANGDATGDATGPVLDASPDGGTPNDATVPADANEPIDAAADVAPVGDAVADVNAATDANDAGEPPIDASEGGEPLTDASEGGDAPSVSDGASDATGE